MYIDGGCSPSPHHVKLLVHVQVVGVPRGRVPVRCPALPDGHLRRGCRRCWLFRFGGRLGLRGLWRLLFLLFLFLGVFALLLLLLALFLLTTLVSVSFIIFVVFIVVVVVIIVVV